MARVPTYDGAQVRTTALQPVQQREIDVSSGMRATGQALTQVADVADKVVRRDAETEANRIDSEITSGWLQWDAENRRKYQGQNADEYDVQANKWWDKARETHGVNLSPLVQQAIGQQLARKRGQALASVTDHVNTEKERFADHTYDAAQRNDAQYAVTTGDTVGITGSIKKRAGEYARRKGLDTDGYEAEVLQRVGTMHLTMVQSLAETSAAKAAAYYAEAKKHNEIPATAQPGVEKLLKAEGDNQFAQQFAAQQATKPLSEQLKAAGEITDGEKRKKALTEIHNNHTLVKAAQTEKEAVAGDEAWQLVGTGKRVPETVLMRMDGKSRVQLQEHVVDRARHAADRAAGKEAKVKTDWDVYEKAREAINAGEKVDLRPYDGTKLSPEHMKQLIDLKTSRADPKKAHEVASTEQQMSAFTKTLNLQHERLGQFQSAAYDRFNMHLEAKGKEATYNERRDILEQLTVDVVTKPGFLWDSTAPAYQATKTVRDKALSLPGASIRVTTRAEALALKPGTKFVDPQGVERTR